MEISNKRQHVRQRLAQPAHISVAGDDRVYPTVLLDVSTGGARLRVARRVSVRDRILVNARAIGGERQARVVWSDATSIGVSFEP